MVDRSHLSIGEVLGLLQVEFPDVTISKIRFLESQGLLDPERTPSGYRKFYEGDIDRLRWVLRQQREHFLPLKVIRERLDEADRAGLAVPADDAQAAPVPATSPQAPIPTTGAAGAAHSSSSTAIPPAPAPGPTSSRPGSDGQDRPGEQAATLTAPSAPLPSTVPTATGPPADVEAAGSLGGARHATRPAVPPEPGEPPGAATSASNPLDGGPTGISLTATELAEASGLTEAALGELERYGLLAGRAVGADTYYDGDALVVARTAAGFLRFGIEARHLRMYKVAAEREAGFFEQVVMPLLKQRNPQARRQAGETLGELAGLGDALRGALLRAALSEHRS